MSSYSSSDNYEAVQIISCDEKGRLGFDSLGFRRVLNKIPYYPIAIISVAGNYRIGKSFLINSLIPVLEHYERYGYFSKSDLDFHNHGGNGFEYKSGKDSKTKGIHLLNRPFIIPNPANSCEKIAVLLMDSQGLNAIDTAGGVDEILFSLTNFLSSHVIFNVTGNIEPNKLLSLISLAGHSKYHSKEAFSSLDILIRDYKYKNSDMYEMRKECKNYVNDMCYTSGSILRTNLSKLEDYFRFVKCYPLPWPGRSVELKSFDGDISKINSKFVDLLYDYVVILFDKEHLTPKFEDSSSLMKLFDGMRSETLNGKIIQSDKFYRMITEDKDNKIIKNFLYNYFSPLKSSYSNLSEYDFNIRIRNVRNMYENVKREIYDKSKLDNYNVDREILYLQSQYRQKLENDRLEEQRRIEQQKQEKLRKQQIAQRQWEEAQEQRRKKEREELKKVMEDIQWVQSAPRGNYRGCYHDGKLHFMDHNGYYSITPKPPSNDYLGRQEGRIICGCVIF